MLETIFKISDWLHVLLRNHVLKLGILSTLHVNKVVIFHDAKIIKENTDISKAKLHEKDKQVL